MDTKRLNSMRQTPVIVWCIRVVLCGVVVFVWKYFVMSMTIGPISGRLILGGYLALALIGVIASFIRSRSSLIVFSCCIVAVPFVLFLPMDLTLIKGPWYEQLLSCIGAFVLQMLFPLSVSYYVLKAPKIRSYYIQPLTDSSKV
jgi:hypothetical protein